MSRVFGCVQPAISACIGGDDTAHQYPGTHGRNRSADAGQRERISVSVAAVGALCQPQCPADRLMHGLGTFNGLAFEINKTPRVTREQFSPIIFPSYSRKSLLMPRCFARISSPVKEVAQLMYGGNTMSLEGLA